MNLEISLVPNGSISAIIPGLLPHLQKSELWTRGRSTVDDILRFLFNGHMQLWIVFSPEEQVIYGHVITEVKQYPQCKMLVIQYCAGEENHMQYCEDRMYELLDKFAKDTECAGIELIGRPGWSKHVKKRGYEIQSVMYQKFFKDQIMSILRWKQKVMCADGGVLRDGGGGGGGGGPPPPTTSTTYSSNVPEYAQPYVENMLQSAQKQIYSGDMTTFRPYQPYSSDVNNYFAGFQPIQQRAQSETANMQTPGQFGIGAGLTGLAGAGSLGAGQQYTQNVTDPAMMQAYMSPYQQSVTDVAKNAAVREAQIAQNAQNLGAARQGTYGGARQTLAQAEREKNLLSNLSNIQAQGSQSAYDRAIQSQQFGSTLGMQGYGQAIGAGSALGQLGGQQQAADLARLQAQQTVGAQQQSLEQQKINQAIANYSTAQQYPFMQLGIMNAMLRGLPLQQTTTATYQQQPSTTQQLTGLGGAALSYLGRREGGPIKEMREGGITDVPGYKYGKLISTPELEKKADKLGIKQLQERIKDPQVDKGERIVFEDELKDKQRLTGIAAAGGGLFENMSMAGGGIIAFENGGYTKEKLDEIARGLGVFPEGSPALPGAEVTGEASLRPTTKKADKKEESKSTPAKKEPTRAEALAEYDAAMEKRGFGPGATKGEEEKLAFIRSQQADTEKIQRQKEKANMAKAFLKGAQNPRGMLAGTVQGVENYIEGDVAIAKEMEERKGKLSEAAAAHDAGMRARAAGDIKTANEMFAKEAEIRKDIQIANINAASANAASNLKTKQMDAIRSELEAKLGRKPTEVEVLSAYTAATTTAGETAEARAKANAQVAIQKWKDGIQYTPEYQKLTPAQRQELEDAEYNKILKRQLAAQTTTGAPQQAAPAPASVSVAGKTYNRKDYPQMTDEQWAAYVRQTKG